MSPEEFSALDAAYRATTYRVHFGDGDADIRVDQFQPRVDRWLEDFGADRWAYVTAANPGSARLGDDDNQLRQAQLLAALAADSWPSVDGESIADAGDWPVEAGVLIGGMTPADALRLARRFGQNAILAGERGRPARLVWVE